ncbi:biotin--[acetyl-CoA-carboxylase] ligase [Rickettsia bellii]|uniref:biotin--[biotin carboxyl-carrier protein] ligase n=1 Tax=Rickettsia bellii str. RML An4 TaxID=1359193 RepID=A0A0F3QBN9_RICBE|nr:biotin--[acetyl-CoA-carboxylase] ligase [Rickettsia bellii]ARD86750.1 biotin--[acetyl-CoA-carboxylase] ligase [Rickettsia bellii]KJV89561.1 biotin--[acetyl-CoA-carboxylase] ligase [Rickettsia bellii str. RML An4]
MNLGRYKLFVFDELDSTNLEAIRIAKSNKPDRDYIILAKSQTKGRGRSGKNWQSTLGNLHVSLLIKPNKELELLPQLSFVTALAVYDSMVHVIPWLDHGIQKINEIPIQACGMTPLVLKKIQLKWPNDVLVGGKKISGILLESVKVEDAYYLIIGVGINITYHPINIDQPTTSLVAEELPIITPQALLEILIENFEKYYQIWEKNGFSFIRGTWLKHAYKLHENISVKYQNNIVTGTFQGIDSIGRIILQLPSKKILSFSTAELSF